MKLLLVFMILVFSVTTHSRLVEKILAVINSDMITSSNLYNYKKKIKNRQLIEDSILKRKDPKKLLANQKELLDHMIDEKILDSEIQNQKMSPTLEQVEKEIRKIASRSQISKKQLMKSLKKQNITPRQYREFLKKSLGRHQLLTREIGQKIQISEKDINSYLTSIGQKTKSITSYKIAHILFSTSASSKGNAKKRAQKVLKKLTKKNFKKLVKKYSDEKNVSEGGLLGTFESGEMLPAIETAISSLKVGEHTQSVKTPSGYHILKLLSKTKRLKKISPQVRNQAHQVLYQKAFSNQLKVWLKQKRAQAFIKKN